jgi:hypothetical protein
MSTQHAAVTTQTGEAFVEVRFNAVEGFITVNINGVAAQFSASAQNAPSRDTLADTIHALKEAVDALPIVG